MGNEISQSEASDFQEEQICQSSNDWWQPKHAKQKPVRVAQLAQDYLPHGNGQILAPDLDAIQSDSDSNSHIQHHASDPTNVFLYSTDRWRTKVDPFGIYKEFLQNPMPLITSESSLFQNSTSYIEAASQQSKDLQYALGPFRNYSEFALARLWFNDSNNAVTLTYGNHLTHQLFNDPLFNSKYIVNLDLVCLWNQIAQWSPPFSTAIDKWQESSITISVPLGKNKAKTSHLKFPHSVPFTVNGFHHCKITSLVHHFIHYHPSTPDLCLIPYRQYCISTATGATAHHDCLYSDCMSSDRMISAFEEVQKIPLQNECQLQHVVIGLQFWSDATKLASFGSHKLWPIYLTFSNLSNSKKQNPNLHCWYDVAYIPTVS